MTSTGISDTGKNPDSFEVLGAYPNPFNPDTTVSFTLDQPGNITVDVFNVAGQKVDTLIESIMNTGRHDITWKAGAMSSGVYFIRVHNGFNVKTVPVTLLK